jgi:saccharopine dehydrogenase-like NADP-dependent oxidoreductase
VSTIAVFGAGRVAGPAIRLLLERGHRVHVKTDRPHEAPHIEGAQVDALDARDEEAVRFAVSRADLALSLLPASLHLSVARACVRERKPFLSTSYASPEIQSLDRDARTNGVLLFNECGLDPGIDHLLAIELIENARRRGARITAFRSLCGGIPAPESNDNPLGYKVSWSTRGVALAGSRPARFLEEGEVRTCGPGEIFLDPRSCEIPRVGALEFYPNGDAIPYARKYGIEGTRSILRGTLRWPGWCETWRSIAKLGWLDDTAPVKIPRRAGAAASLGLPAAHPILDRLDWLGLFEEPSKNETSRSMLDHLVALMDERLPYRTGEKDLVVLRDEIVTVDAGGKTETTHSTLVEKGTAEGSAMSRLVGVPAALAACRILDGTIAGEGVRIPDDPETARLLLQDLAGAGIVAHEAHLR